MQPTDKLTNNQHFMIANQTCLTEDAFKLGATEWNRLQGSQDMF